MVIQRGWKILSDTGSTSASSTEANRSPMGGLNSSSDDSNCSNQTTHSMVTSVASPTNNINKMETSSLNSSNSNINTTNLQSETMVKGKFYFSTKRKTFINLFSPSLEICYNSSNCGKYFAKIAPTFFQYHTIVKFFSRISYAFLGISTHSCAGSI